jgi:hypothetical protein
MNKFSRYLHFDGLYQNSKTILNSTIYIRMYLPVYLHSNVLSSRRVPTTSSFLLHGRCALKLSISMTKPQSQISQVLWTITDEFCPRTIAIDGRILWVSTIGPSHFIVSRLWLPSGIKLICSKSFCENQSIQSVVIENMSKLKGIESEHL